MKKMRATVFHGVNDIRVEEVERPHAGALQISTELWRVFQNPLRRGGPSESSPF